LIAISGDPATRGRLACECPHGEERDRLAAAESMDHPFERESNQ
jgi:hypothetical protein